MVRVNKIVEIGTSNDAEASVFKVTDGYDQVLLAILDDALLCVSKKVKAGMWLRLRKVITRDYQGQAFVQAPYVSVMPIWSYDVQEGLRRLASEMEE